MPPAPAHTSLFVPWLPRSKLSSLLPSLRCPTSPLAPKTMEPVSPKWTPLNPWTQVSLCPGSCCSHMLYHRDRKRINTLIKYWPSSHLEKHFFKMAKLENKLKSIYIYLMNQRQKYLMSYHGVGRLHEWQRDPPDSAEIGPCFPQVTFSEFISANPVIMLLESHISLIICASFSILRSFSQLKQMQPHHQLNCSSKCL